MIEHINGYALALFDLAKEEKKLTKYKKQAFQMIDALEENIEYITLLNSKFLSAVNKQEMAKKSFQKFVDKNLLNFIYVIIDRSKMNIVIPILKKLIKFINIEKNVNEGVVFSTDKLSKKEVEKIEEKSSKILGKKIALTNELDATMVSGIRVIVGDEVIEDSIKSRLEQIKNELLEESEAI